ncbi:hypothetical protein [Microbacterium azadirachtae]|uniref:Uncharacterized protein n=1 Tax=Microbacterium azadirachtae TaxID=582680 RepID=A0A0F0KSR9_9MICO|nr:hypothetical protein [Microbacterium azadirachtae]KJL23952.1 hypothetical protein RL72_01905 [Microbacterium azadirachtae]SDM09702.1 hypothetical protein SAMN04488593_2668 [Microbacterium azadirachtae]SEG34781.1 hypothetical protein SAMN04488594_2654 [Microbacterium azadirachtae]SEG37414.1 hypothetical protein SAMN04488592_2665 [Microbacterium azadirachtae]
MSGNSNNSTAQAGEQRGLSRRTVVRGAAWSLPVIAMAVAAPLASASTTGVPGGGASTPGTGGRTPLVPSYQAGSFCKHPGNPKYYHGTFSFENTTAAPLTIVLGSFLVNGQAREAKFSAGGRLTSSYTVPPKKKVALYVDAGLFTDSANGTATLSFAYSDAGVARTGSVTAPLGKLPPCAGDVKGTPAHAHSGPVI